jgi:2-hydroxychromene-2-carboxylate isomerase
VLVVESGNQPPPSVPAKLAYMNADIRRWASRLNVPFVPNPAFPVRSITLMRAALVAQDDGVFPIFHPAMWRAMWTEAANLADPAVITAV